MCGDSWQPGPLRSAAAIARRTCVVLVTGLCLCFLAPVRQLDRPVVAGAAVQSDSRTTIDTMGGEVSDLAGTGDRLFLAVGAKLYVLTIPATGDAPQLAGLVGPFDSPAVAVAAFGDVAFAALESGAVVVIDASLPSAPTMLATVPFSVRPVRLVADARHLYYAAERRPDEHVVVMILDASLPERLSLLATVGDPLARGGGDIAVQGSHLYVSAGVNGIGVWDVADVRQPRLVGWEEDVRALRLSVDGDLLVVLREWVSAVQGAEVVEKGYSLYRTSDDGPLEWLGDLRRDWDVEDVTIGDSVVYARGHGSVEVIDVSDPTAPLPRGSLSLTSRAALAGKPYLHADRLFIGRSAATYAEQNGNDVRFACLDLGVSVVDVRDAGEPRAVASWSVPAPGETSVVAARGGVLVVGDTCGVRLYDITVPSLPVQRSYLGSVEYYDPHFLALADGLLFVLDDWPNLTVVDLRDLGNPLVLARIEVKPADPGYRGGVRGMAVGGGRVAIVSYRGYVTIVDTSDPAAPGIVFDGQVLQANTYGGAMNGDMLFAATDAGLAIVDMSHPSAPTVRSTVGRPLRAVAVDGEVAYGAVEVSAPDQAHRGLLDVIDISNTARPIVVGSLDTELESTAVIAPWTVTHDRGHVAVTCRSATLHVVDVADPTRPGERPRLSLASGAHGAAASQGVVYVAAGSSGLVIVGGAFDDGDSPLPAHRIELPVLLRSR